MKNTFLGITILILSCFNIVISQAPEIVWQNTIGGSGDDRLFAIQQTNDGGYILGGRSNSGISGDKTEESQGGDDYWIVKINSTGDIVWQNTIGGSSSDRLESIQQTTDGGYILGGHTDSGISGDKSEVSQGSADYWVVKLDGTGDIEWQNTIGGDDVDNLYSIQQTIDGGYILGGFSRSGASGDKTETNQGNADYWVVKLDVTGQIVEWQNSIGGSSGDYLYSIQQTIDGGYILGGRSSSEISGEKTEASQGSDDFWVVKLDGAGQSIEWQKTIGGSEKDVLWRIRQTSDGGYLLGGETESGISGDKIEASQGERDGWVVKLDATGQTIEWQNTIGTNSWDQLYSVQQTTDGGYLLGMRSDAEISGDKTEASQGAEDFWVVKLDATGQTIEWQNTIGGSDLDILYSVQQTMDGGYILGGRSLSGVSGDKTEINQGDSDYWVVKLGADPNFVGIDKEKNETMQPNQFTVLPAYPNPFNPSTTITFGTETESKVSIKIYDITGKLITTLLNGEQTHGWHSVSWNGMNQRGEQVTAGLYLSRITSGNEVKTTKLMLLK